MAKIQKIIYKGVTYYLYDDKITDSSFLVLDTKTSQEVAEYYFSTIDTSKYTEDQLFTFLTLAKNAGAYSFAYKEIKNQLNRSDIDYSRVKAYLPVFTSLSRILRRPQDAIDIAEKYIKISSDYESIALFVSLAAAYCDVKEYEKAFRTINVAYAMQGGGVGYKNELSLVYARIKKESGLSGI